MFIYNTCPTFFLSEHYDQSAELADEEGRVAFHLLPLPPPLLSAVSSTQKHTSEHLCYFHYIQ